MNFLIREDCSMKRIIILTALAAAFLTACNQELNIEGNQPEAQSVVFTATTESPSVVSTDMDRPV